MNERQTRQPATHTVRFRIFLAGTVLAAVGLRALYLWEYSHHPLCSVVTGADVMEYDRWAREMIVGGVLWDRIHIHGPLYPMFLGLLYRVTAFSLPLVRLAQLLVDVGSLCLVAGALFRLGFRRAALWTAVLWSLFQPLIYYSGELYSELLVVFWLSAALFLWSHAMACLGWRLSVRGGVWVCAMLCCGFAVVAHPLSLCAAGPFGVLGGWVTFGRSRRQALLFIAAGFVALALQVIPVVLRNAALSGEFVLVQGNEGLNLYIGNNPAATGTCYVRPGADYEALVNWPAGEGHETAGAARRFFVARVLAFVRSRPLQALRLVGRKVLLTWNAVDITSGADLPELQLQTVFMQVPLVRFGMIAPLAFAGLFVRLRKRVLWPLVALPAGYTLALGVLVTSARYRLGMMPGVLALAGIGCDALWRAWRVRGHRIAVAGLAAAGAGFVVAFVPAPPPLPGSAVESALMRAEAAWKQARHGEAERILARAMSRERHSAAMFHLAGNILSDTGRPEMAVEALRHALALDPTRVKAYVDLAVVLSESGRTDEARDALELALGLDPRSAEAWYNMGILKERAQDADGAVGCYRAAARLDPLLASAKLNAAILEHRRGNPVEALALYRSLLRIRPDSRKALAGKALALAELGRKRQAIDAFERALHVAPDQPHIWQAYGQYLRSCGERDAADAVDARATEWQQTPSVRDHGSPGPHSDIQ